jgi:hypothetical protein
MPPETSTTAPHAGSSKLGYLLDDLMDLDCDDSASVASAESQITAIEAASSRGMVIQPSNRNV